MPAFLRALALLVSVLALAPATAQAAEIEVDPVSGALSYEADDGEANAVELTLALSLLTITDPGAPSIDTSDAGATCLPPVLGTVTCTLLTGNSVKIDTGDLDDTVATVADRGVRLLGGSGHDHLSGGNGDDRLEGYDGSDELIGGPGDDRMDGDDGSDLVDYSARTAPVVADLASDVYAGEGGEADRLDDIELIVGGDGDDRLTAADSGMALTGGPGHDELVGGEGLDSFAGDAGDDRIEARDQLGEEIACGDGADAVLADSFDIVDPDCEQLEAKVVTEPAVPAEDAKPAPAAADPTGRTEIPPGRQVDAVPELGESLVAEPNRGTVRIKRPGDERFHELGAGGAILVGSTLDARRGSVVLTAAGVPGELQRARFTGAVFTVRQGRSARAYTVLVMRGRGFARCPRPARARSAGRAGAASVASDPKRVVRSLWGSGHGRFRTRGRHGAASVRGTVWQVQDRCDGTLTRVRRGRVAVRDLRRQRTVMVPAGKHYLVRTPR